VPTRIANLDVALRGGFLEGMITILSGKFKSGKTTVTAHMIKELQRKNPGREIVWYASEDKFDEDYFRSIGVNTDPDVLIVYPPMYMERICDTWLRTMREEPNVVAQVADSLRGLVVKSTLAKSVEEAQYSPEAAVQNKFIRQVVAEQGDRLREGNPHTSFLLNHERDEIGGSPLAKPILPGGQAQMYLAATRIRMINAWAKDSITEKAVKHKPKVELSFSVESNLGGPGGLSGKFNLYQYIKDGFRPGWIDSYEAWRNFGRMVGYVHGRGTWKCGDREYDSKEAICDHWREDNELYEADQAIILPMVIQRYKETELSGSTDDE